MVDLKRLWSVRGSFFLIDFEDESAESIKELLLKTLVSPFFLKSPEASKSKRFVCVTPLYMYIYVSLYNVYMFTVHVYMYMYLIKVCLF